MLFSQSMFVNLREDNTNYPLERTPRQIVGLCRFENRITETQLNEI